MHYVKTYGHRQERGEVWDGMLETQCCVIG